MEVKYEALVNDPSRCSTLSMEQKRELIHEFSKWPDAAVEMLQSWSRPEILQIICAELGKERKYTGLTKSKMIEHLMKIVYEKKSLSPTTENVPSLENDDERTPKRQRKSDHPNIPLPVANSGLATDATDVDLGSSVNCKNSACKAKMNHEDLFCKRCSCCICRQYDDNKDPGLWLICNLDPPFHGPSCGMSCHLECALRHENSGISQDRQDKGLDGSFCCVSCGKVNDLLSSWRKQLVEARDTRRVDILCYRLSLGQKILMGTKHYQNLYRIIDEAVKKLEEEVGPLTGLPVKKARGIVNRLPSGPEIQRLCASAVESLDLMLSNRVSDVPSDCNTVAASKLVRFEDISASSVTVILNSDDSNMGNVMGYSLWHRKADETDYPSEPTYRLFKSSTKFSLSNLTPATQYFLKVVILDADREMGCCEFQFQTGKDSNVETSQSQAGNYSSPSSVENETNNNNTMPSSSINVDENRRDNYLPLTADKITDHNNSGQKDAPGEEASLLDEEHSMGKISCVTTNADISLNGNNIKESSNGQMVDETSTDLGCAYTPERTGMECIPYVCSLAAALPITPCKFENNKDGSERSKMSGKDIGASPPRVDEQPQAGSSSEKKRSGERREEKCNNGVGDDKDFGYYVKVIRWLECEGHIETEFRQKFLTWYSWRATNQEVRVVKAFVDTFIEDPESLAGQLLDAFADIVSNKRCSTVVPAGFCRKLWH